MLLGEEQKHLFSFKNAYIARDMAQWHSAYLAWVQFPAPQKKAYIEFDSIKSLKTTAQMFSIDANKHSFPKWYSVTLIFIALRLY